MAANRAGVAQIAWVHEGSGNVCACVCVCSYMYIFRFLAFPALPQWYGPVRVGKGGAGVCGEGSGRLGVVLMWGGQGSQRGPGSYASPCALLKP